MPFGGRISHPPGEYKNFSFEEYELMIPKLERDEHLLSATRHIVRATRDANKIMLGLDTQTLVPKPLDFRSKMLVPKFEVEKFDGSNDFRLWKLKLQALLGLQGLAKALEGKEKLPGSLPNDNKEEMMAKARSIIQLNLADNVLREVMEEKTADSLWKALEDKYSVMTLSKKLYQRKRLYTFKYLGAESMQEHIDNFNQMISNVGAAGIKVEDVDQAMILLTSLPASYDNFCDIILYDRSDISVKNVKESLMMKEHQKLVFGTSVESPANRLFMMTGRSQERGSGSKSKRRSKSKMHKFVKCFHCHQTGHIRRNCPKRKEKSGDSANITIESSDDSDAGC